MSHHIYTTPGFIVSSRPQGEAGKFFLIFARDLGMIGVTAQGVRFVQSKLRYHTQDYDYSLFSLVRGKEVWRATGAVPIENLPQITDAENLKIYVQILSILRRLLPGEEKNEKLFDVIHELYMFLAGNVLDQEKREMIELVTMLRILNELGYVSKNNSFVAFLNSNILNDEIVQQVKAHKNLIVKEINNALKESQL